MKDLRHLDFGQSIIPTSTTCLFHYHNLFFDKECVGLI